MVGAAVGAPSSQGMQANGREIPGPSRCAIPPA